MTDASIRVFVWMVEPDNIDVLESKSKSVFFSFVKFNSFKPGVPFVGHRQTE